MFMSIPDFPTLEALFGFLRMLFRRWNPSRPSIENEDLVQETCRALHQYGVLDTWTCDGEKIHHPKAFVENCAWHQFCGALRESSRRNEIRLDLIREMAKEMSSSRQDALLERVLEDLNGRDRRTLEAFIAAYQETTAAIPAGACREGRAEGAPESPKTRPASTLSYRPSKTRCQPVRATVARRGNEFAMFPITSRSRRPKGLPRRASV